MASRDIKVGLFVTVSLLIVGIVVFLIGEERKLFAQHEEVRAAFKDVNGLKRGSPVRMGGVDIGTVKELGYGTDAKDDTIFVQMKIVSSEAERIREDSVAEVKGKGLLGDKMIVVTVGDQKLPRLKSGELVKTREAKDLEAIVHDLKNTAAGAERVISHLEKTTEALAEESFHGDIKSAVSHLNKITESLETGRGYAGKLLTDEEEAARISEAVSNLRASSIELNQLLASAKQVMRQVQTGPGFAHEMIYGQEGSQALAQIGGAAEEARQALRGLREGDSLASRVLYKDESGHMLSNLNEASGHLKEIVADVRAGKGTVGAFLVDPSVYEDIKVLLGNVGRNRSLKALVRYSISQDEKNNRVVDPKAGTEVGASLSAQGTASSSQAAE